MRRFALLVVLVVLLPSAASARVSGALGDSRAALVVAPLSGVPAAAARGDRLLVKGAVAATGRRAGRVELVAVLRDPTSRFVLGAETVRDVAVGQRRGFALGLTVPTRELSDGPHRLRVCAHSRNRRSRCSSRTVAITSSAVAPTPAPSASPAATATATAGPAPATTVAASASATASATATPSGGGTAGAETAGDVLFPNLGNGGYDAQGYEVALSYTPAVPMMASTLAGTTRMAAIATQTLSRFSMDLQGFTVSAVTVDGVPATTSRVDGSGCLGAHKLRVTPAAPIPSGSAFTVTVTYSGVPVKIVDCDNSPEGFLPTDDGAFVVGEPAGSMGWFPNNNHPSDKATFKLSMTVPTALDVIGNGELVSNTQSGLSRTFVWNQAEPMATYLATATLGPFTIASTTTDGLAYYDATDGHAGVGLGVGSEPAIIALFSDRFGPYPFSITGSIVDNYPTAGYSLETQTKPIYPSGLAADDATVSHELGHQWFGDSLSPRNWQDIWLNEGFAEFSSELFQEGGGDTKSYYDAVYAKPSNNPFWTIPPAKPAKAADIFAGAVYQRGQATLAALRLITGDAEFFQIMRTWATDHRYGNVTTSQFLDLVKQISSAPDSRLDQFFEDWLYDADKPSITPANF